MTPIVKDRLHMSELPMTPVYEETSITLRVRMIGILVYQNDKLIAWIDFSIMKVVRAIRRLYPNAKMNVI
jgi:hypothetical protein